MNFIVRDNETNRYYIRKATNIKEYYVEYVYYNYGIHINNSSLPYEDKINLIVNNFERENPIKQSKK